MGAEIDSSKSRASTGPSFVLHDDSNGIDLKGWNVRSETNPIATSTVEESLSEELGIKLPGMLFDRNRLSLAFQTEDSNEELFQLHFNAVDALRMVGEADPNIKVRAAARWDGKTNRSDVEIGKIDHASDWTFSTKYPGTVKTGESAYDELSTSWIPTQGAGRLQGVDYSALRNTELPILFSAQNILFEDELDDNGTASYRVRLRVMPDFFFILARFFLRVDGVLIRIYDTRYFHRFGSNVIVRECSTRQADLSRQLRDVHPSILRDADLAAQQLSPQTTTIENIPLPNH